MVGLATLRIGSFLPLNTDEVAADPLHAYTYSAKGSFMNAENMMEWYQYLLCGGKAFCGNE